MKAALASSEIEHKQETKKKAIPRKAAGQAWEDPTLSDWPESITHLTQSVLSHYCFSFACWTLNLFLLMSISHVTKIYNLLLLIFCR